MKRESVSKINFFIVGLGNPGKQYEKTRHNMGFAVIDELKKITAAEYAWSDWEISKKCNAHIAKGTARGKTVMLMKPLTYMNASGVAVQLAVSFYKINPSSIIVAHDDKDIMLGEIKTQTDRGSAGHNGVESVITELGTKNFTRIRVGVANANPKKMEDIPKFVLSKFTLMERATAAHAITKAAQTIASLL